ncbi:MAG: rod shape-determining protein MreC [Candidatus Nanopelagicaceae bacterium]
MVQRGSGRTRLLLVTLLVTSLLLITLDLRGVSLVNSFRIATQTILKPFQSVGSAIFSPIGNFFGNIANIGQANEKLDQLEADNKRLLEELAEAQDIKGELKQLKDVLDLASRGGYKVVAAKVIAFDSAGNFEETITLDIGSSSGLSRDMTVISGKGVVGVVKSVTSRSAIVQLISDPGFRMGVRIAGTQAMGILSGEGSSTFTLELLDARSTVKEGDVLLSRGSTGNRPFPPGLPVGVVTSVDDSIGALTKSATVRAFANLGSQGVVSVILSTKVDDPRDALLPKPPAPTPIPTVTVFVTPTPTPTPTPTKTKTKK